MDLRQLMFPTSSDTTRRFNFPITNILHILQYKEFSLNIDIFLSNLFQWLDNQAMIETNLKEQISMFNENSLYYKI